MSSHCEHLKAIVFDWAGTTIDHGSCAPAIVFQEIFRQRGISITAAQAREPMGMAKRDHIAAITGVPEVSAAWRQKFDRECTSVDIDAMYEDFLPLQKATLKDHSLMIPGAVDAVNQCRELGLRIGSSTGYTRELMEIVSAAAREQGYEPDCVLCVEDAPRGRPTPYLLYEAAKRLDVYPTWAMIKVDDTPVGITAGRNAGCWTVGVTRTGNCVGKSLEEIQALPAAEVRELCQLAEEKLRAAGAHFIVESVADCLPLVQEIERKMQQGQLPI